MTDGFKPYPPHSKNVTQHFNQKHNDNITQNNFRCIKKIMRKTKKKCSSKREQTDHSSEVLDK